MITELIEVQETESWDEICLRLGRFLGLNSAVPSSVMRRAMDDPLFAHDLISCRNTPAFLNVLMSDPANKYYEPAQEVIKRSSFELASKAAGALLKWGKAGFSQIDKETYERRYNACLACEYLVDPPNQIAYKISFAKKNDRKICNACGCVAAKKARIPTEACPMADPTNHALNRWGEPMKINLAERN
jgi:hypothetical protein